MEEKRKKRNIILGAVILAAALAMALLPVLLSSAQKEADDTASILSAVVERSDIRSTISGGGTLTEEDAVKVSVPKGVEVKDYLVTNGDWVEAGQPIASVDKVTVMSTIAIVQKNLEHLDQEIQKMANPATTAVLFAPSEGRVKAVYIQKGDKAADVMAEHGALMVLSLDGRMALKLETEAEAEPGDTVTVTLSDGRETPGRIEHRQGNELTVTLTDDGPAIGETVTVTAADGTALGTGELYVHSAWNLTAVSGTVNACYMKEEQQVWTGNRLCYLENMDGNGRYDQLSAQRREYEDAMLKLFSLYQTGAVTAPEEGRAAGIDTARVGVMRASEPEYVLVLLSETGDPEPTPEPTPVPDPNTASAKSFTNKNAVVGKVTFGSITFLVQGGSSAVGSYANLPSVDYADVQPQVMTGFSGVSIYGMNQESGKWEIISPSVLAEGDLLYFVYDGEGRLIWIVRPVQPENLPGEEFFEGGGGGGGGYEEPFEMYDLTETELLRLVPQHTMTVQVTIDELDILSVAQGQEAEVTVDALPGRAFTGTVSHIDPNGQNQGGNTKYTVTIAIDRDPSMLAGMNATAILTVGVTEDLLTLPAAALTEKGSKTLAYTGYDEQTQTLLDPVEVETGVSDGTTVEILSGLEEGDTVWYSYYEGTAVPVFSGGFDMGVAEAVPAAPVQVT